MTSRVLSLLACAAVAWAPAFAAAGTNMPVVPFPPEAKTFEIAGELQVNGVPMHISGFVSPQTPQAMREWLVRRLPRKTAEASFGAAQVLGYAEDGRFVSLQIQPELNPMGGTGTRVTVSVSRRASAIEQQRYTRVMQRWRAALPARAQTLTHMASVDNGLHSTHLTVKNRLGATYNRSRIADLLQRQGWQPEQPPVRTLPPGHDVGSVSNHTTAPSIDWFRGKNGDQALLTITATQDGNTQMVLNILTRHREFTP